MYWSACVQQHMYSRTRAHFCLRCSCDIHVLRQCVSTCVYRKSMVCMLLQPVLNALCVLQVMSGMFPQDPGTGMQTASQ